MAILLGAPTFLRPLLQEGQPAELRSLELVVTGAEKLTEDLRLGFLEKFHIAILQGYGLTETSPVSNMNQSPTPWSRPATADIQVGNRVGTVGRLLPRMAARVIDPEGAARSSRPAEAGILLPARARTSSPTTWARSPAGAPRSATDGSSPGTWPASTRTHFITGRGPPRPVLQDRGRDGAPRGRSSRRISEAVGADPGRGAGGGRRRRARRGEGRGP